MKYDHLIQIRMIQPIYNDNEPSALCIFISADGGKWTILEHEKDFDFDAFVEKGIQEAPTSSHMLDLWQLQCN